MVDACKMPGRDVELVGGAWGRLAPEGRCPTVPVAQWMLVVLVVVVVVVDRFTIVTSHTPPEVELELVLFVNLGVGSCMAQLTDDGCSDFGWAMGGDRADRRQYLHYFQANGRPTTARASIRESVTLTAPRAQIRCALSCL